MNVQNVFRALSDPTRRDILMMLAEREMSIGEVSERFEITRAAVKKHLVILREGDLISVHSRGREKVNRLEPEALRGAADWIGYFSGFWDGHIAALQEAVKQEMENRENDDD